MHYHNPNALGEMGNWLTDILGLTQPEFDPKRYPKVMTISPVPGIEPILDAAAMPLPTSKPKPQEDEEAPVPMVSLPPKTQVKILTDADAVAPLAKAAGVSTGLPATADTPEETPKQRADRMKAEGTWNPALPPGIKYSGPSGGDLPPVKKSSTPWWWLLPVGATVGAGSVIAAQKIRGRKKATPKVQYYPQPDSQSALATPIVLLGGVLVVGLLGYAALAASRRK